MLEQMRARTDDTHLAAQHIPELRNFIDTELPEKSPEWINAIVAPARVVRDLFVARTHRAKFVNGESAILNSGTHLLMEKRPGRLQPLRDPDDDRHHRKHHGQNEPGNDEINRSFDETIERILQRFFAQGHETKSAVLEVDHRMTQRLLQVAEYDQTHSEFIACFDDCAIGFGSREFQQDDLGGAAFTHDPVEIVGLAENGKIARLLECWPANESGGV